MPQLRLAGGSVKRETPSPRVHGPSRGRAGTRGDRGLSLWGFLDRGGCRDLWVPSRLSSAERPLRRPRGRENEPQLIRQGSSPSRPGEAPLFVLQKHVTVVQDPQRRLR